jgi:hypothetical protein
MTTECYQEPFPFHPLNQREVPAAQEITPRESENSKGIAVGQSPYFE